MKEQACYDKVRFCGEQARRDDLQILLDQHMLPGGYQLHVLPVPEIAKCYLYLVENLPQTPTASPVRTQMSGLNIELMKAAVLRYGCYG